MQEITDLAQLSAIQGGLNDCDFINAWQCQYLYGGISVLFTAPFILMAPTFNAAILGTMAGVGMSYLFYRAFSGYFIPECAVPSDYITFSQSCV